MQMELMSLALSGDKLIISGDLGHAEFYLPDCDADGLARFLADETRKYAEVLDRIRPWMVPPPKGSVPPVTPKFFCYSQNNSGGSFDQDHARGICEYVIVEAVSPEDADKRAESIGLYFGGCMTGRDCPCCGDRWSSMWDDGDEVPSIYGDPVEKVTPSHYRKHYAIHRMDGTFTVHAFSAQP